MNDEPCKTCNGTGQIGEEQFYLGRSVGWKACPDCEAREYYQSEEVRDWCEFPVNFTEDK